MDYLLDHLIEFLSLILTAVGGTFALYQWRISTKNNHAEYVDRLLSQMTDNELIHKFLFDADYEVVWYDENFHSDTEHNSGSCADKAFFFLNYLCYLKETGLLSKNDFVVFEYHISIAALDKGTKAYFLDLYQNSLVYRMQFPFRFFLKYCIAHGYISEQIKRPDYFKQVMMIESNSESSEISEEIREINSTYGKRLYLESCSRCKHCKHYDISSRQCENEKDTAEHFWLCVNPPCEDFFFEEQRYGK